MATSYPDRTNARGIWKISDITRNIKTEGTFPVGNGRGIWMGGGAPSASVTTDYITFSTSGDATDFGDLSKVNNLNSGGANFTRCLNTGGQTPGVDNIMEYVHFSSTGNFADFGDLTDARGYTAGMANTTRQLTLGGLDPSHSNIIDFVEIATLGNAVDFGDLTGVRALNTCHGSPTRGISAGGVINPGTVTNINIIDFIQYSTTGNATDFGDLLATKRSQSSFSSQTRMCMAAMHAPGTVQIEKIEIASLGDATDFAEAVAGTTENGRGTSDSLRGVYSHGGVSNVLDTKNIFDGGAAADFGDLTVARTAAHAASNAHGGLSGFDPRPPELYSPTGRPVASGGGIGDIGWWSGGDPGTPAITTIEFCQISTLGNAQNFGDLGLSTSQHGSGSNSIRGIISGGEAPAVDTNQYITITTKGNAASFGDLTASVIRTGGLANSTRYVRGGGLVSPNLSNVMDYVVIATIGNASDFGDLTVARQQTNQGTSSTTRGVFAGGNTPGQGGTDVMDYITIGSTGNATDFGDLSAERGFESA